MTNILLRMKKLPEGHLRAFGQFTKGVLFRHAFVICCVGMADWDADRQNRDRAIFTVR